jgi:hypothetical protein
MKLLLLLCASCAIEAAVLEVGAGKRYADIAAAVARAKAGDGIAVYPAAGDGVHRKVGVMVRTPQLTIRAFPAEKSGRVVLDGAGFDHSGRGKVPRALFQFDPQASGCTLEGFVLRGGNNASHNGAGVRVNQANGVTIRNCEITANQMGIMSNGSVADGSCDGLVIESCHLHRNGEP